MKGYSFWSFDPYKPPLFETGDIYINRIAPTASAIHFEWNNADCAEYSIYCRKRDEGEFAPIGTTTALEYDITGLDDGCDYEFYVTSGELKSRVRLARCADAVGTVVNYLHPDDDAYSFSGRYLCSPSLVRMPDGSLLASMDVFAGQHPQNLTLIFRSEDDGKTWKHLTELMPCFWGKLFLHKNELYMLSVNTEYGDLLIGKSTDGGKTFGTPTVLLRGANGKNGSSGVHKNPQNVYYYKGRIYNTLEWGAWANKVYCHAAMVMSCDVDDDLLIPENWSFTEPVVFDPNYPEFEGMTPCTMQIEGTITETPTGEFVNIMRFGKPGHAIIYGIDAENPEAPLKYLRTMPFDGHNSKFTVKYDEESGKYWTIATRIYDYETPRTRNLLTLMSSSDLKKWDIECDLFDYRHCDAKDVGFQYVDYIIEGEDMIFLCRTAMNGAHNYHDANYSTFSKILNFRDSDKRRIV